MPAQPPGTRPSSNGRNALIVVLAVIAIVAFQALNVRPILCYWEDDGVYLATAKSMAEGHGYRHAELPGEPWQTKYPPLYPWLLSLVLRAEPNLEHAWPGVVGLNVLFAGAAVVLAYFVMRRRFGAGPWLAATACSLTAINAVWFQLQTTAMSEPLCAALLAGAFLLLPDAGTAPDKPPRRAAFAALAGLCFGLGYLTRILALPVGAGAVAWLLVRRRWLEALCAAAPIALCAAAWTMHRAHADHLNAAIPQAAAFAYDLDYTGVGLAPSLKDQAWVVWNNLFEGAYALLSALMFPRLSWVRAGLDAGAPGVAAVFLVLALTVALVLFGIARTRRAISGAAHAGIALYVTAVIMWPWSPVRFFIPVLPLLTFWLLKGAADAGPALLRISEKDRRPTHPASVVPAIAVVVVALACAASQHQYMLNDASRAAFADPIRANADAINRLTPPSAVIASRWGGVLHLLTGRKFVPVTPALKTVEQQYPADRAWWRLGMDESPGRIARHKRLIDENLDAFHDRAGVTYLLHPKAAGATGDNFINHFRSRADRFTIVAETPTDFLVQVKRPR